MNSEQETEIKTNDLQRSGLIHPGAIKLYQTFTAPEPSLSLEEKRKAVFFLSTILGMILISVLFFVVRLFVTDGQWVLSSDDIQLTIGSLLLLAVLFGIGKTKAYFAGIIASFFIILASVYYSAITMEIIWPLNMLFVLQLLGAILLSPKFMRWSTVGMIGINILYSLLDASVEPLDILLGPSVYLLIGLVIATFSQRYRAQRESDRRIMLEQREERMKDLFSRSERQRNQLEVLTRVSQTLIELQDLDSLLEIIIDQAMALLDCGQGGMYLLREDEQELEWVVARGENLPAPGLRLKKGEGLSGRIWEIGEPMAVTSYHSWEGRLEEFSRIADTVLGVPVMWRDRLLGVLNIAVPHDRQVFYDEDVEIMNQFAAYTAIALHNANLYQQIQAELLDRQRAEEALLDVEYRYHSLFDSVPVGLYRTTPEGEVVDVNQHWLTMMGFTSEEKGVVLAKRAEEFFAEPVDREVQVTQISSLTVPAHYEVLMVRKDGSEIWVRDISHLVVDPDTGCEYFEGSLEDITAEKEAARVREELLSQIQHQADQMLQIIRTVPEGVVLMNEQGVILETNPPAQEALTLLTGEIKPKIVRQLGDRPLEELLTSPPRGLWHEVHGHDVVFEVVSRPLEAGPRNFGWVLVLRDITMERQIRLRQEQQEQLAAIGQLAGGIAHDFNNILAVISLQSEMSLMEETLTEDLRERIGIISSQTEVAAELIQQILDFSRQTVVELKDLDLVSLVKDEVRLLERTIPENIVISYLCEEPHLNVRADPTRIRQVVLNLAVNARDAMPDGGELEFILDQISYPEETGSPLAELVGLTWARFRVRDTGVGIPEKDLAHIFDPFFTTKEPGKGSGLGLAQVYGIVQQHQGVIHAESSFSLGTCFSIYLPILENAVAHAIPEPKEAMLARGGGQLVLVVEDNDSTRKALASVLELLNYDVLQAENGYQALEVYREWKSSIDVVVSDLVMPEMGGKALLYALKELDPDVKLILLTGHLVQDDGIDLAEAGAVGWIQKPVSIKEISALLADVLGPG